MKTEFKIPLYYTIKRYMIRQNTGFRKSVEAFFSSLLRDYVWVPLYALIVLDVNISKEILGILLHLITFSIAYEMGYLYTDNISILKEDLSIRKVIYETPRPLINIYYALLIRCFVLGGMLVIIQPWSSLEITFLYILIPCIYLVYGNLKEKFRIPFFIILRFLKGFLPYAFLLFGLSLIQLETVSLLIFATALFFSIEYITRKLKITYINIQQVQYIWVRYLIIILILLPYILLREVSFYEISFLMGLYIVVNILMLCSSQIKKVLIKRGKSEYLQN